jgi:TonB family protein
MKTASIFLLVLLPFAAAFPQGESGKTLIDLGIKSIQAHNPDQAFDYFDRARNTDSSLLAKADLWMGVVRENQKRLGEAEGFYRDAVYYQSPESPDILPALNILARFLRSQNRTDEATIIEARANEAQHVTAHPELPPGVYRVGGAVRPPSVVSKVDPEYAEEARIAKLNGTVTLLVEVDPDGIAHNITVTGKLGMGLDEKAVEAVEQWRFNPGTKDGQPVPVMATIEVNFRLL